MAAAKADLLQCDILVVGAGLSGLTAAYRARQKWPQDRVIVVDAKDRVGGRLLSVSCPTGFGMDTWDLGGSWVGKEQTEILNLLEELNMETYPQYFEGEKFLQVGAKHQIKTYQSSIPKLSLFSLIDLSLLLRRFESDRKRVGKPGETLSEFDSLFDSMTLETYIDKQVWTQAIKDMTSAAFRVVNGCEMSQSSLHYILKTAEAAGDIRQLIDSSPDAAQGMKVKGGTQSICFNLSDRIGRKNILLNTAVEAVEYDKDGATVKLRSLLTEESISYRVKFVIMAIPPTLMKTIKFSPDLPVQKANFYNSFHPGHLIKVILTYRTAFWREMGFSGEIVTNGGPAFISGCSTGPLCVVFDATTSSGSPALVGFIGGRQAEEYDGLRSDERKDAVLQSLAQFFPKERVNEFASYVEKNWRLDRYCGGSPVAVIAPGSAHLAGHATTPLENKVFFCGTEFATRWNGFMSGAVQSADRAIAALSDFHTLSTREETPDNFQAGLDTTNGVDVIRSDATPESKTCQDPQPGSAGATEGGDLTSGTLPLSNRDRDGPRARFIEPPSSESNSADEVSHEKIDENANMIDIVPEAKEKTLQATETMENVQSKVPSVEETVKETEDPQLSTADQSNEATQKSEDPSNATTEEADKLEEEPEKSEEKIQTGTDQRIEQERPKSNDVIFQINLKPNESPSIVESFSQEQTAGEIRTRMIKKEAKKAEEATVMATNSPKTEPRVKRLEAKVKANTTAPKIEVEAKPPIASTEDIFLSSGTGDELEIMNSNKHMSLAEELNRAEQNHR